MSTNEYELLVDAYKTSKGYAVYWDIHSITVSHRLFLANHAELTKKLESHAKFFGGSYLYQPGHNSEMQAEFREIMRQILNYVASVKSLVDHTRRIAKKLINGDALATYQLRVDAEFKDDPLTNFLHDLRNYMLHYSLPTVSLTMRFAQNSIDWVGIELSSQELLRWDGWRKPSVKILNGTNAGIPLAKVVTDYERKVYFFTNG